MAKIKIPTDPLELESFILENLRLLGSTEKYKRQTAISNLSTLKNDQVVRRILASMVTQDRVVRQGIMEVLGNIGTREAVFGLVKALISNDEELRNAAKNILSRKATRFIDYIVEAARALKNEPEVNELLEKVILDSDFVRRLTEFLSHPDKKIRAWAIEELSIYPSKELLPLIVPFAEDRSSRIRFACIDFIGRVKDPSVDRFLVMALKDSIEKIAVLARKHILARGRDIAPRLETFLREEIPAEVRKNVIQILGELGSPGSLQFLLDEIKDSYDEISVVAQLAFEKIYVASLKETELAKGIHDPSNPVSKLIVEASIKLLERRAEDYYVAFVAKMMNHLYGYALPVMAEAYMKATPERQEDILAYLKNSALYRQQKLCMTVLSDPRRELVASFLEMLSRISDPRVPELLFDLVEVASPELQRIIGSTFARLQISGDVLKEKYSVRLSNPNPAVRNAALEILGTLDDPDLLLQIAKSLKDPIKEVRLTGVRVLSRHRSERIVELISQALITEDSIEVMAAMFGALGEIGLPSAMQTISRYINHANEQVKNAAISVLVQKGRERFLTDFESMNPELRRHLGTAIARLDPAFVEGVCEGLYNLNPAVRLKAINILTSIYEGDRTTIQSHLLKLLTDPDKVVRATLVKALGIIGGRETVEVLISLLNDEDSRVRANVIEVLSDMSPAVSAGLFYPFLMDENNRVRANAALALYRLGHIQVIDTLTSMLESEDRWMRASAVYALGVIGDPRVRNLLIDRLRDPASEVVVNVIRALEKLGEVQAVHLTPLLNSPSLEVRNAAKEALQRAGKIKPQIISPKTT